MLTRDRPEMAQRAVRCFREQNYKLKKLLIYNTGEVPMWHSADPDVYWSHACPGPSIGALRNAAIDCLKSDMIVTFDDDDVSHPNRMAEQVALLQSSGADAVGYSQTLFWDTTIQPPGRPRGEAWIYSGHPVGASLCYWRRTWERIPFEDVSKGEDDRFIKAIKVCGGKVATCSGMGELTPDIIDGQATIWIGSPPRLVHHIHGGNTCAPEYARSVAHGSGNWRRAAEWDEYCGERMKL